MSNAAHNSRRLKTGKKYKPFVLPTFQIVIGTVVDVHAIGHWDRVRYPN